MKKIWWDIEIPANLLALFAMPWLLYQSLTRKGYGQHLLRRIGFYRPRFLPNQSGPRIVINACSVGENSAIFPLVAELKKQIPEVTIIHAVSTETGFALAQKKSTADIVVPYPLENWLSNQLFMSRFTPDLFIAVETEIWPAMFLQLGRADIPIVIVNGRISDRSMPRYRFFRQMMRRVLSNVHLFCMQSAVDAHRIITLGASAERVVCPGNLKFDSLEEIISLNTTPESFGFALEQPVFTFGSIHPGEEQAVVLLMQSIKQLIPECGFIIAPRKFDHMDGLFHLLAQQNLPFVRRTLQNDSLPLQGNILILDTVGELVEAYRRSLAAFVGGSFVPTGGHNILEVTAAGRHVYFGPSMHNFREFEELALSQHLGTRMETPEAGQGILANDLLNLQDLRQRGIENQHRLIRLTGASRRTARLIKQFLSV